MYIHPTLRTLLLLFLGIFFFLWIFFLIPRAPLYTESFSYTADIFVEESYFDLEHTSYRLSEIYNGVMEYTAFDMVEDTTLINGHIAVMSDMGSIYDETHRYAVDTRSGEQMIGFGDKNRSGYLFGSMSSDVQETFLYWHILYDEEPFIMHFLQMTDLHDVSVGHYQSTYDSGVIDVTDQFLHIEGVPEIYHIMAEPTIDLWVDMHTGYLVSAQEETLFYYADPESGETLAPFNHRFSEYTQDSIQKHAHIASDLLFRHLVIVWLIPFLILLVGIFLFLWTSPLPFAQRFHVWFDWGSVMAIIILSLLFGRDWFVHDKMPEHVSFGGGGMQFSTILNFFFSAIMLGCVACYRKWQQPIYRLLIPIFVMQISLFVVLLAVSSLLHIDFGLQDVFLSQIFLQYEQGILIQPSIVTIFSFILIILIGLGFFFYDTNTKRTWMKSFLLVVIFSLLGIAFFSLLSHLFFIQPISVTQGTVYRGMPVITSLFFLWYGFAALSFMYEPSSV